MLSLKFYGVRGSFPSPSLDTSYFGGNTSCVAVVNDDATRREALLLDVGSGAIHASEELVEKGVRRFHIFLSHLHWDHVQGFPFMSLLDRADCEIDIYASSEYAPLEQLFSTAMSPPLFPVVLKQRSATIRFVETAKSVDLGNMQIRVHPIEISHSDPVLGYRIDSGSASIAYLTDHQCGHDFGHVPAELVSWAQGVNTLIHDAQYTKTEFLEKSNWGHSTYEFAVKVAELARVKRLIFFHHDPKRSDDELRSILKLWESEPLAFKVLAAKEGEELCVV